MDDGLSLSALEHARKDLVAAWDDGYLSRETHHALLRALVQPLLLVLNMQTPLSSKHQ